MYKAKHLISLLFICSWLAACGIGIGNPTNTPLSPGNNSFDNLGDALPPPENFEIDCGDYDNNSTLTEIEEGRQCVRDALENCNTARYYIDLIDEEADERFNSYVEIEKENGSCVLVVRTVSSDPDFFLGDRSGRCSSVANDELPELCGLL